MLVIRSGYIHSNTLVQAWTARMLLTRTQLSCHSVVVFTLRGKEKQLTRRGLVSLFTRQVISDRRRVTREWINGSICIKLTTGQEEGGGYLKQTTLRALNRCNGTAYWAEARHDFGSKAGKHFNLGVELTIQTQLFLSLCAPKWNVDWKQHASLDIGLQLWLIIKHLCS